MASYLTTDDCIERFGQTTIENLLDKTETEMLVELNAILDRNEALIHGYISSKYTTPVTAPASLNLLEDWMLSLVQYDLHQRSAGDSVQERVRQEYMDVIWQLKGVQKGEITLPGTSSDTTQTGGFAADSDTGNFAWGDDAKDTF